MENCEIESETVSEIKKNKVMGDRGQKSSTDQAEKVKSTEDISSRNKSKDQIKNSQNSTPILNEEKKIRNKKK